LIKTAVIVAGGSGKRMGNDLPKQFLPLLGCPILVHTLQAFWRYDSNMEIALVLPTTSWAYWNNISERWLTKRQQDMLYLCEGGLLRMDSVYNGLQYLSTRYTDKKDATWVAIHDGVRPFATPELLEQAYNIAFQKGASVACVPVKASLRKYVDPAQSEAVDRSQFLEVQTPQTFRLDQILAAFSSQQNITFTDDASLFEAAGNKVAVSPGSYDNIKITTPEDLELGAQIYRRLKGGDKLLSKASQNVKLLLLDVDGTLTNGGLFISSKGETFKQVHVRDSLAIRRLMRQRKIQVGLISSGNTPDILTELAREWGVSLTQSGKTPKLQTVEIWLTELGLHFDQVAYIGDDLNDLAVIQQVGFSACPADADSSIRKNVDVVLDRKGGEGCVREFIEVHLGIVL